MAAAFLTVVLVVADVVLRFRDMPAPVPPGGLEHLAVSRQDIVPQRLAMAVGPVAAGCDGPAPVRPTRDRPVAVHVPAGDAVARAAVVRNCDRIDLVLAERLVFDPVRGGVAALAQPVGSGVGRPVFAIAAPQGGDPDAGAVPFLDPGPVRDALVEGIAAGVAYDPGLSGLCLDLSGMGGSDPAAVAALLEALRARTGPEICLVAGIDAPLWADAALVAGVDLAVARAFVDPATPTVAPAPPAWLAAGVARVAALVPGDRLVVALGTAGHVWQSGRAVPGRLSFAEGMALMAGAATGPVFLPDQGTLRARMVDAGGRVNDIWLPDAAVIANQLRRLDPAQAVALWPVGAEDPAVWTLLGADLPPGEGVAGPVGIADVLLIAGRGPFVTGVLPAREGWRDVTADPATGEITGVSYGVLPLPQRATLGGVAEGVTLAFNGLPDDDNAAPLVEALADAGLRAAFLVTPEDILGQEAMLRALHAAGHEIGLRPVGGPGASALWRQAVGQGALVQVTGVTTLFARPAATMETARDIAAVAAMAGAGYLPLAPGVEVPQGDVDVPVLVARVRDRVAGTGAGVVLFDLGANSAAVAQSLPGLIAALAQEGFRFVTLSAAAGLEPAEAMPPPATPPTWRDRVAVMALDLVLVGLTTIFLALMVFAALRAMVFLALALWRGHRDGFDADFHPPVTVIVPAYNEEKVIERCVRSLLALDYPDLRIVVVDDGSTDRTYAHAMTAFRDNDRVTLLHQPNGGKWSAANLGLSVVTTPFFVIADADSVFFPDTVRWLVQPFREAEVGAVAGLVEVGNRRGFLTACQALEYIVSQSVMRRAYEVFEGILVVPGAVGAWRTAAVRAAQDFSGETITEDADLTVAVHRAGYRVRFQEQARAVTEAPEAMRAFLRQRLRWTFGMFQVSWKHRRAITEGRPVGISIVDAVWFGLFSSLLSPLVDLLLVVLVVKGGIALATGGVGAPGALPVAVVASYFLLTGLDILNTLAAFRFERRMDWRLLALVPLLRFGYRQLLYIATINAIWHALVGQMAGWNKLERSGAALAGPRGGGPVRTEQAG